MNNILSLDLSSKSSGWCVGNKDSIIKYGCITSTSTINIKRIIIMRDAISHLIKEYNIRQIVIEEVRTDYKNIHTYKILTWLQAAIVIAAYEMDPKIEIIFIQPSSWRAKIGIHTGQGVKREELKRADIAYVKNKYNIDANDDICDSICIYDAFIQTHKDEMNWI